MQASKAMPRQRHRRGAVLGEALADRTVRRPTADGPLVAQATQRSRSDRFSSSRSATRGTGVAHCRCTALHPCSRRRASRCPGPACRTRLEGVVAGQRRVARVELALRPLKISVTTVLGLSHQTSRGTQPKKSKARPCRPGWPRCVRWAGPGRRGSWSRPRRRPGPAPGAAVGEIDVDVAEVGLQAVARVMGQGDEGLAVRAAGACGDVASDLVVAAGVAVLVAQAAEDLHGGVPLLGRGVLVGGQDWSMSGVERAEDGRAAASSAGVGIGLGCVEDLRGSCTASDQRCGRSRGCSCHREAPGEWLRNRPP